MKKVRNLFLPAILLALLMTACPDPGSSETPDTPESETDATFTEEDIRLAIDLIYQCLDSNDIMEDTNIPDSGVSFDEANSIVTFSNYDISGYSFNTPGYLTISGTYCFSGKGGDEVIDITLTDSASYHIQCTLDGSDPLSVWVNDVEYQINYYEVDGPEEGIPDNCNITYDTETTALIHTPRWPDESERITIPGDYEYCTASKEEAYVTGTTPYGSYFSYEGKGYPFSVTCSADVNSAGSGQGTLLADSIMDVTGMNFPGASSDMEYQAFGDANHRVYFSARSDDPDTETITVEFSLSVTASLEYSIDNENDHATSFTSLTADGDIWEMGWYESEMGYEWADIGRAQGADTGSSGSMGYAIVGFTDRDNSSSQGIFQGDIVPGDTNKAISGGTTLSCDLVPETQMNMLSLNLMARSIVEFTGINTYDEGEATAKCLNAMMTYSYSAFDPDHPDAEVTVNFYIPEF